MYGTSTERSGLGLYQDDAEFDARVAAKMEELRKEGQ
jgi:hypothetical protein